MAVSLVHRYEELLVVACFLHAALDEVHGLYWVHLGDELAQNPCLSECEIVMQQVVSASA